MFISRASTLEQRFFETCEDIGLISLTDGLVESEGVDIELKVLWVVVGGGDEDFGGDVERGVWAQDASLSGDFDG